MNPDASNEDPDKMSQNLSDLSLNYLPMSDKKVTWLIWSKVNKFTTVLCFNRPRT